MKKVLCSIVLSLLILFPTSVFAEGYISVSPSSLTIEQGSSKTFTITAYNTIGDVSIKSNNSGIASVSTGEWGTGMVEEKVKKTGSITVTGKSVGTTTITLTIDAATFDGDDLAGQTKTVTVKVVAKPASKPSNPQPPQPQKSTNNNLKSLSIDGFELVKVDNNNYSLTVSNDITSINVNALAEDSKANVTGIGTKDLQVGENNFEVIITSESGTINRINIKITRKDGYYLEDLDSVLKNDKIQDADIIITADSKITKEQLEQIRTSSKTLRFNYFNEEKKLLYSWTINGKQINDINEVVISIDFTTENQKEIYKLSNYADGLYINFKHSGNLPNGTKIKLYVGDKFENGNVVNLYQYNEKEKKLDFIKDNLEVVDGYIEFEINHCSEYFVTMSIIGNKVAEDSSPNIFMILTIISIIIIIGLAAYIYMEIIPLKIETNGIKLPKTLGSNNYNNSVQSFNEDVKDIKSKNNNVENNLNTNVNYLDNNRVQNSNIYSSNNSNNNLFNTNLNKSENINNNTNINNNENINNNNLY